MLRLKRRLERVKKQVSKKCTRRDKLEDDIANLKQECRQVAYYVNHPIWANLMDILPRELIKICCDYYSHDICDFNHLFPKYTGCIECFPPTPELIRDFHHENFEILDHHNATTWSDVQFESENVQEVWRYLQAKTSNNPVHIDVRCLKVGLHLNTPLRLRMFFISSQFFWTIELLKTNNNTCS